MPSSSAFIIPHIIKYVQKLKPKSVLDVGIGFGKYGFLLREYMDVCSVRYQRDEWEMKIDGIEICPSYIGELQRLIYDKIFIEQALDILGKLESYDLILSVATLEHLEKKEGIALLKLIREKSKVALISTPVKVMSIGCPDPGKLFKNKYETHRCQWTQIELESFGQVETLSLGGGKAVFLLRIEGEK